MNPYRSPEAVDDGRPSVFSQLAGILNEYLWIILGPPAIWGYQALASNTEGWLSAACNVVSHGIFASYMVLVMLTFWRRRP